MSAKVPVAPVETRLTTSPDITPKRDALTVVKVAVVVPSYTLLFAVAPVTVNPIEVILAVVVGCTKEYFPASAPLRVSPAIATILPGPTFLFTKLPVAPVVTRVTTSGPTTPTRTALPVFIVAVVVPS